MANEVKAPTQRSNSAYIFTVLDGRLVWDYGKLGKLVLDPDEVKNEVKRRKVYIYGLKQIVNDGAAVNADKATGKASVQEKFDEAKARIERLLDNDRDDWKVKPGEAKVGVTSYVTQALVRLGKYQGQDVSDAKLANEFVKRVADTAALKLNGEMGKARAWLEANSKAIRQAIADIRAEEAPAVDADEELAKLMGQVEHLAEVEDSLKAHTPEEIAEARQMFDEGRITQDEAEAMGVKFDEGNAA